MQILLVILVESYAVPLVTSMFRVTGAEVEETTADCGGEGLAVRD